MLGGYVHISTLKFYNQETQNYEVCLHKLYFSFISVLDCLAGLWMVKGERFMWKCVGKDWGGKGKGGC